MRFALLLFLLAPLAASAQTEEGSPLRESHTLVVFEQLGIPYYRVLHQTDQLNVAGLAGGALVVDGQGVNRARVILLPDGTDEATQGAASVTTSRENAIRAMHLRKSFDGSGRSWSQHEMIVQVCTSEGEEGACKRWTSARPYPTSTPPGIITLRVYDSSEAARMPAQQRAGGGHVDPDDD